MEVCHTYGVVGLVTGANGSSSPSIGRREPQDPGPPDLLHTNLNPGTYGHKISSEKTLSQKNPISTAGAGQKPEVKTRLRSKASISSLFTTIKVLRL